MNCVNHFKLVFETHFNFVGEFIKIRLTRVKLNLCFDKDLRIFLLISMFNVLNTGNLDDLYEVNVAVAVTSY